MFNSLQSLALKGVLLVAVLGIADTVARAEEPARSEVLPAEARKDVPTFDVLEYRIEGNDVLPALTIERAVYPHLGERKTIEDVEKARKALEDAYQQTGFLSVFVDIPEQEVGSGVVTLRVTEGKIDRLRVSGNRYYSGGRIKAAVPSLSEGTVPNFNDVQRELAAVNRSADRKVTPLLRPGAVPGAVEVELNVDDKRPLHGEVELNNRQTQSTSPLRLQASVRYENLWQRGHSVSLTAQTAPQDTENLRVLVMSYLAPLSEKGDLLALYAVDSNSNVAAVGTTNVVGKGSIVGARRIFPLRPRGSYFHTVGIGIDYKDFGETVRLGSDTVDTPISYVPISGEYRFNFATDKAAHRGAVSVNFAPRGFSVNEDSEFARKRFNALSSYIYLRGDWLSERRLSERNALRFKLLGQIASQPLVPSEQFFAGGAQTVRGYFESERLGDGGVIGSLEARRDIPTKWSSVKALTALVFVEGAVLRVRDPLPGQTSEFSISSVGVGLRMNAYESIAADLDLAIPLQDGQTTKKYDPRLLFLLAARF